MLLSGTVMKLAFGVLLGGRMIPGGTSRIVTDCGFAVENADPVAVATIDTQVPGTAATNGVGRQTPMIEPLGGAAGAVKVTVATPFAPVTTFFADSVPKSAMTPSTSVCRRMGTFGTGLPSGPTEVILMRDV